MMAGKSRWVAARRIAEYVRGRSLGIKARALSTYYVSSVGAVHCACDQRIINGTSEYHILICDTLITFILSQRMDAVPTITRLTIARETPHQSFSGTSWYLLVLTEVPQVEKVNPEMLLGPLRSTVSWLPRL